MQASDYDLIIFDCDGVLVDSELISARIFIALLKPFGIEFDFSYIRDNFFGRSFSTVAATIRREYDVCLPADFERSYRAKLLEAFEADLKPTDGIASILTGLQNRHCVASSSSPERVHRSLALVGLDEFFEGSVFTASEVERGKPAPDLFLHVAMQYDVDPSKCLVIEDSVPGVEAAQAARMAVWRYVGGGHLLDLRPAVLHEIDGVPAFDSWADFTHITSPTVKISDG